jgi:hypothetical protein
VRVTAAWLALAAGLTVVASIPCAALDLMTGDGYLLALAQDEAARNAADEYLAGTDESQLFCVSSERAGVLDGGLLRREFTEWLRDPSATALAGQDPGMLPLGALGLAFLVAKFPCEPIPGQEANPSDAEIRSRLLRSVPK